LPVCSAPVCPLFRREHRAQCAPVALFRIWMGKHRDASCGVSLDGFDLYIWDNPQSIPPLPQNTPHPAPVPNLYVAQLNHGVMQEQMTGEHGQGDEVLPTGASGPHLELRHKDVEALRGLRAGHQLLARAAWVKRVPMRFRWLTTGRLCLNLSTCDAGSFRFMRWHHRQGPAHYKTGPHPRAIESFSWSVKKACIIDALTLVLGTV
jgi:hypothetical protein